MSRENEDALKVALDAATQAISAPVLAGELPDWFDRLISALDDVEAALVHKAEFEHPQIFDEIANEDTEMLSLVERMQQDDQALLEKTRQLKAEAQQLKEASERLEPRENVMQEPLEKLNEAWMTLFLRINKQEAAITTFLQEALQRDRGAVD